jgi:hypothetical protein
MEKKKHKIMTYLEMATEYANSDDKAAYLLV